MEDKEPKGCRGIFKAMIDNQEQIVRLCANKPHFSS